MTDSGGPFIDLNADIGEGAPNDAALLGIVSSANICCGAHAGSPALTRRTIAAARAANVRIGAHPGYPDRDNFGRVALDQPLQATIDQIVDQVLFANSAAQEEGTHIAYVKLHGAIYNQCAKDESLSADIFSALRNRAGTLRVMVLAGSAMQSAAEKLGLGVITEGFADRAYRVDGTLTPRTTSGAVLHNPEEIAAQAVALATGSGIVTADGARLPLSPDSLCLHGDNAHALDAARRVRRALEREGVGIGWT